MDELGITSIRVGKDNKLTVKANEMIPLVFTFTRPLKEGETVVVECHLNEKQYDLNKTYGTFTLLSKPQTVSKWIIKDESPSCDSEPIHITLPEELAGATVNIHFSMKSDPNQLLTNVLFRSRMVTLEVESSTGAPKIEAIHWSDTKEIKFGTLSAKRTDALYKNETVYLHIHTRGLYGKQLGCMCKADSIPIPRTVTMKENIAVLEYKFSYDNVNEIEITCSPLLSGTSIKEIVSIPYIKDQEVELSTKTKPVLSLPTTPKKKDYASEAKCRVDFRPKTDYDGSFGFSWYRIGDMNTSTGYTQSSQTDSRTKQTFDVNKPCNDQPFSEREFGGSGILGRHYETVSNWIFWKKDRIVKNGNDSGTGSGDPHISYDKVKVGGRDNFVADLTMADDHKKDYPKISLLGYTTSEPLQKEYLAPVMTLVEGKTVELQFFLHIKETPKKILFVFDNPRAEIDGVISINAKPSDITSPAVTAGAPPSIAYTIEITCNKKFDKELRLKAYAIPNAAKEGMIKKENGRLKVYPIAGSPLVLPELCGMLRFLPNDDAHWRKIDVVFFNVRTKLDSTKDSKGGLTIPTIEILLPSSTSSTPSPVPVLPPASSSGTLPPLFPVSPPVATPTLPPLLPTPMGATPPFFPTFPSPPPPPPKPMIIELPPVQVEILKKYLGQAYVDVNVVVKEIDLSGNTDYENMCIDTNSDGIKDRFDYPNHATALRNLLTDHNLSKEYDAKNHYRLYFMPDKAVRVGGWSSPGKNFTICFPGMGDSIPAHELGHTLGLPHTFNGNTGDGAKYTYEDGKTDNIMDYAHFVGIDAKSFFHWQWEALNTNLNK